MQTETHSSHIEISEKVENLLSSKINECFSNGIFDKLLIQIIHRVIKESSPNTINNDKLFDMIKKSLNKFCVLFPFLNLQKITDDRLEELCKMYSKSNENTVHYFDYLNCNLTLINEMNNHKKKLQKLKDEQ